MRKLCVIFIGIILLSVNVGCVRIDAPSMTEDKIQKEKRTTTQEIQTTNYYKIYGKYQDVGDYTALEDFFVHHYRRHHKPIDIIYDTDDLSFETLRTRTGTIICERCIGIVTDRSTSDGQILNTKDEEYNYISYKGFDQPYTDGTVILTYLVYNPETDFDDDIIDRYDYVLTRDFELS